MYSDCQMDHNKVLCIEKNIFLNVIPFVLFARLNHWLTVHPNVRKEHWAKFTEVARLSRSIGVSGVSYSASIGWVSYSRYWCSGLDMFVCCICYDYCTTFKIHWGLRGLVFSIQCRQSLIQNIETLSVFWYSYILSHCSWNFVCIVCFFLGFCLFVAFVAWVDMVAWLTWWH